MAKLSTSEPRVYGYVRVACGILTHLACVAFTALTAVVSRPGTSLFSWHPFFMTLAFSLLMTEAILVFSPSTSLIWKLPHKTKGRFHWLLQGLCATCATLGLAAICYNKHLNGKPHFHSWHGLLGVVTVCGVALQSLAALPLIYTSLARGWSLARLKRYHATCGLVVYLLGSASLFLGACSAWFTGSVVGHTWYLAALCPALCALAVMSQVTDAYMAKKHFQS
ncbi:transmembrane reductase CYB561D2 isoform X1 [Osmerus eperlanus]|uniref:transmembrane reductase CYB561D2 isoform X1 n=1 Tax=Osmerus eperlanus TaxID=29151 RepID=UPI002E0E6A56